MFCNHCGRQNPDGARFCNFCGAAMTGQVRAYKNPVQNSMTYQPIQTKKKGVSAGAVVGIVLGSVALSFILFISSCTCLAMFGESSNNREKLISSAVENSKSKSKESTTAESAQSTTELPSQSEETNYLISGEYSDSDFVFAVEIDSFDGDIYSEGQYRFYPTAVNESRNYVPTIWDIYVSDELCNNISALDKSDYIDSVGGLDKREISIDLEKGEYVYIVHNEVLLIPTGILKVEKQ